MHVDVCCHFHYCSQQEVSSSRTFTPILWLGVSATASIFRLCFTQVLTKYVVRSVGALLNKGGEIRETRTFSILKIVSVCLAHFVCKFDIKRSMIPKHVSELFQSASQPIYVRLSSHLSIWLASFCNTAPLAGLIVCPFVNWLTWTCVTRWGLLSWWCKMCLAFL